jgi:hypothetical protein
MPAMWVLEGNDMGFILGLLTGLLTAIGLFAFLACWLCTRPNTTALAKLLNDIAQALAHRQQSPEPSAPGKMASRWGRDGEVGRSKEDK